MMMMEQTALSLPRLRRLYRKLRRPYRKLRSPLHEHKQCGKMLVWPVPSCRFYISKSIQLTPTIFFGNCALEEGLLNDICCNLAAILLGKIFGLKNRRKLSTQKTFSIFFSFSAILQVEYLQEYSTTICDIFADCAL